MRIVHLAGQVQEKPKTPSKSEQRRTSARRWMAIQYQASLNKFLKDHEADIKEIKQQIPDWEPIRM